MKRLPPDDLRWSCDDLGVDFEITSDLDTTKELVGQQRAQHALELGTHIDHPGYNMYVLGPPGSGRHYLTEQFLTSVAANREVPPDLCYVYNFDDPNRPRFLELPHGRAPELSEDVDKMITALRSAVPKLRDSDPYRTYRRQIEEHFEQLRSAATEPIQERAREHGIIVEYTPTGWMVAPRVHGEVLSREQFRDLPDAEQERLEKEMEKAQDELRGAIQEFPQWEQQERENILALEQQLVDALTDGFLTPLREKYKDVEAALSILETFRHDVVKHSIHFKIRREDQLSNPLLASLGDDDWFRRYHINVLVSHDGGKGAPIVYEDEPSLGALVGRIEYEARFGTLVTHPDMIRPGSLHKANGGYLVVDAHRLLTQPLAYDQLKQALNAGEIRVVSTHELLGLSATASLEPEPVPLHVKVILVGDRRVYYLLNEHDPDFAQLFKVAVDLEDDLDRSPENTRHFVALLARLAQNLGTRPLHRSAVCRLTEQAARFAEDRTKLSLHIGSLSELLRESDYWAAQSERTRIERDDVLAALRAVRHREGRIRDRMQEQIERGTVMVDTTGTRTGQVNGLAAFRLGRVPFGRPFRITATVQMGKGEVVDIEREVSLGGPIHSKGVLILAGYVGARYVPDTPLSLKASLVFEQSYAFVEGDSASLAELSALLSALADAPVRQGIAVTGSVNQLGEVQAVGGVNEKIEGFFEVCKAKGLDGTQGVIVPATNVRHLMLGEDVVQAVRDKQFHVWAVRNVDEAIEILTGQTPGERGDDGRFTPDSVNARVEDRLLTMTRNAATAAAGARSHGGLPA